MQVIIRLYYPADIDLLALKFKYGRRFPGIIKNVLDAFINKKIYTVSIPASVSSFARSVKKPVSVKIVLQEGTDDALIHYLSNISNRKRSDVIKLLVRASYQEFPFGLFYPSDQNIPVFFRRKLSADDIPEQIEETVKPEKKDPEKKTVKSLPKEEKPVSEESVEDPVLQEPIKNPPEEPEDQQKNKVADDTFGTLFKMAF